LQKTIFMKTIIMILSVLVLMTSCVKTRQCKCIKTRDNEEIVFPITVGTFKGAKATCQDKNSTGDYKDCHLE